MTKSPFLTPSPLILSRGFCFFLETEVGGRDNGDAHLLLATTKGGTTGAPPFFTDKLSNVLEGVECFRAEHVLN